MSQKLRRHKNRHRPQRPTYTPGGFVQLSPIRQETTEPEPVVDPADKAKLTTFNEDTGRITLAQYTFLTKRGYDGNEVRRWTFYHAKKVIYERYGRTAEQVDAAFRPKPQATARPKVLVNPRAFLNQPPQPTKTPEVKASPVNDATQELASFIDLVATYWNRLSPKQRQILNNLIRQYASVSPNSGRLR